MSEYRYYLHKSANREIYIVRVWPHFRLVQFSEGRSLSMVDLTEEEIKNLSYRLGDFIQGEF